MFFCALRSFTFFYLHHPPIPPFAEGLLELLCPHPITRTRTEKHPMRRDFKLWTSTTARQAHLRHPTRVRPTLRLPTCRRTLLLTISIHPHLTWHRVTRVSIRVQIRVWCRVPVVPKAYKVSVVQKAKKANKANVDHPADPLVHKVHRVLLVYKACKEKQDRKAR